VVGDDAESAGGGDVRDQRGNLLLAGGVEALPRLVHDKEAWAPKQGLCQPDLAPGALRHRGERRVEELGEMQPSGQLVDPCA
jgi:hypothetical protein